MTNGMQIILEPSLLYVLLSDSPDVALYLDAKCLEQAETALSGGSAPLTLLIT